MHGPTPDSGFDHDRDPSPNAGGTAEANRGVRMRQERPGGRAQAGEHPAVAREDDADPRALDHVARVPDRRLEHAATDVPRSEPEPMDDPARDSTKTTTPIHIRAATPERAAPACEQHERGMITGRARCPTDGQ